MSSRGYTSNPLFEARGRKHRNLRETDSKSECEHNPTQLMRVKCTLLHARVLSSGVFASSLEIFRKCSFSHQLYHLCHLLSHDDTLAAASGVLLFLAHVHSLATGI
jgi:hypothetical protein